MLYHAKDPGRLEIISTNCVIQQTRSFPIASGQFTASEDWQKQLNIGIQSLVHSTPAVPGLTVYREAMHAEVYFYRFAQCSRSPKPDRLGVENREV